MRTTHLFSAVFLLATISMRSVGQTHGTLSGIIRDSLSGEALVEVRVSLSPDGQQVQLRSAQTNRFGFFSLQDIPPGNYHLMAKRLGYLPAMLAVRFERDTVLEVHLKEGSLTLEEILVEGEKTKEDSRDMNVTKIQPALLRKMPSLGGESDLLRTLQFLPGIKAASEISGGLYIRGSSPDQNLTIFDGMPIFNPAHLGGFLSTFNSDALSDVQLIKGAFPAEYGGRVASVLDVSSRSGSKERIGGSAGISLLSSRLTLSDPISERTTFVVSGRRMYADLLLPLFDPEEKAPRYYFYDVNGKIQSLLSESDQLQVSFYSGKDVLNRSRSNEDANFDVHWGNTASCARWTHILSPSVLTNVSLIYSGYSFSTRVLSNNDAGGQDFVSSSSLSDVVFRVDGQLFLGDHHNLKIGADLTRNSLSTDATDRIANQLRSYLPGSREVSVDVSGYVQDEWRITPSFSTTTGIRLNHMVNGKFTNVEPRLSASYALSDDVRIKGAYAIAHQYLHLVLRNDISFPTDLWVRSGDAVPPALATQGVVGIEVDLPGQYLLSLESYYKRMKGLLEYRETADFSFGVPSTANFTSGTGEAYGVELLLEKRAGAFSGWIGYTLAWTKRTFPELNDGKTFYPQYDSRHDASFVLNYTLSDKWEFGATWMYATGHPFTLPVGVFWYPPGRSYGRYYLDYPTRNNYRMPAFHKMDISATHSYSWFGLPFRFSINVYNVYNRSNPFARYVKFTIQEHLPPTPNAYIPRIEKMSLFPILPTIGLSCIF